MCSPEWQNEIEPQAENFNWSRVGIAPCGPVKNKYPLSEGMPRESSPQRETLEIKIQEKQVTSSEKKSHKQVRHHKLKPKDTREQNTEMLQVSDTNYKIAKCKMEGVGHTELKVKSHEQNVDWYKLANKL